LLIQQEELINSELNTLNLRSNRIVFNYNKVFQNTMKGFFFTFIKKINVRN